MHFFTKTALAATGLFAAATVGGCTDGYGGYGMSVGVGNAGYYDSAWGDPYWGWSDDYYYPGTGYYVYDRSRVRHRWNDQQRGYWEGRRGNWRGDRGRMRDNWRDFRPDGRGGRGDGRRGGGRRR